MNDARGGVPALMAGGGGATVRLDFESVTTVGASTSGSDIVTVDGVLEAAPGKQRRVLPKGDRQRCAREACISVRSMCHYTPVLIKVFEYCRVLWHR